MFQTLDQDVSGLKFYSLGIVVKDTTETGGNEITVSPIESLNTQTDGDVFENKKEYKNFHPDEDGNIEDNTLESKQYITATWLPIGQSNRATAPDVIRNETVMLYKFKNVNKYYWTTCFNEPGIRRLEDVSYQYSNNPEELEGSGNFYSINVSTKGKVISIVTDNHDGEACKHTFLIDSGSGSMSMSDDKGNSVQIDCQGTVNVTATSTINLNAPTVNVSGSLHVSGGIYGAIVSAGGIFGDSVSAAGGSLEGGGALDGEGGGGSEEGKQYLNEDGSINFDSLSDDPNIRTEQIKSIVRGMSPQEIKDNASKLGLSSDAAMLYGMAVSTEDAYYLDENGKVQVKPGASPMLSPLTAKDPEIRAAAQLDNRWVLQSDYMVIREGSDPNGPSFSYGVHGTPIMTQVQSNETVLSAREYKDWQAAGGGQAGGPTARDYVRNLGSDAAVNALKNK